MGRAEADRSGPVPPGTPFGAPLPVPCALPAARTSRTAVLLEPVLDVTPPA